MITEKSITLCGHGSNRPSLKNMYDYNQQRYSQLAKNGKHKGLIVVRRWKGGLSETRKNNFVKKYTTIIGRNYYNQARRMYCYTPYYNGLYYSDCSSSGCLTLDAIGCKGCKSFNTESIYNSSLFETVEAKIQNGHMLNPEVLQLGDALEYVGNDPSRPLQIGHVEWVYAIGEVVDNNKIVKEFQKFLNKYYSNLIAELEVDGIYGAETRKAALTVWKYMANRYYGANLTLTNYNFYDNAKKAAAKIGDTQVSLHSTLGYILNGVLAGRGYYSGTFTSAITTATKDAIKRLQSDKGIKPSGAVTDEVWYVLFN